LPQERNNIKNVLVKFTMSKPIKIEWKEKSQKKN
jgi:ribosomal protein L1